MVKIDCGISIISFFHFLWFISLLLCSQFLLQNAVATCSSLHRGWVVFNHWLNSYSSFMRFALPHPYLRKRKLSQILFLQQTRASESLPSHWVSKCAPWISCMGFLRNHRLWFPKQKGLWVPELELWSYSQASQESDMLDDSGCPQHT